MKAVAYQKAGPITLPEALVDIELDTPVAKGHDLLIRVQAVSVNPVDTKIRKNVSAEQSGWKVLGWDAVGTVEAIGDKVTQFKIGDVVWYAGALNRQGSNSELQLVDERIVGHKPKTLEVTEAAALPLTAITAWEMLFDRLQIPKTAPANTTILVIGGAGGVGSITIQLLKQLTNLTIIATASRPETKEWVEQLGADYVLNHRQPLAAQIKQLGLSAPLYVFSTNLGRIMRIDQRALDQLREVKITRNYTRYAEGSVLVEFGHTKVLCTASIDNSVPRFLKGQGQGWVTAEYGMLPRSTHSRCDREAARGKQTGRTQEIQRLIGRSLRAMVDLKKLGENTITIDCDVIQADGGTRTASITGAAVALVDAMNVLLAQKKIKQDPLKGLVAAISVGMYQDEVLLDLCYEEDSNCQTDLNVVMTQAGEFIEIQGTAEDKPFTRAQSNAMLEMAEKGIAELIKKQQEALGW